MRATMINLFKIICQQVPILHESIKYRKNCSDDLKLKAFNIDMLGSLRLTKVSTF